MMKASRLPRQQSPSTVKIAHHDAHNSNWIPNPLSSPSSNNLQLQPNICNAGLGDWEK